jgi:subtilisin family serine protease
MTNFYRLAGLGLAIISLNYYTTVSRNLAGHKLTPQELRKLAVQPLGKNWGLNKFIGVNAYEAWKTTQGNSEITVAVVDTGIDLHHPNLKNNIWTNPGETGVDRFGRDKATNGVDDDGDGLVDDVHGWDFVQNKDLSTDYHGHGTHVAGIIAATVDMQSGRGGVAPKVKVAGFTYYISEGNVAKNEIGKKMLETGASLHSVVNSQAIAQLNAQNTTKALLQAVKSGAQIINYSGGGMNPDSEEKAVLEQARDKGILVVVAAGNEHGDMDNDVNSYYPCNYHLSNIICVGNINSRGEIPPSSNKGIKFVHVFAPGEDIYSTVPGGGFGKMTGTSQATAFVSGVAALILSQNPHLTPVQVKNLIMNTSDKMESLKFDCLSQGKVNAAAALAGLNNPKNFEFNEAKIQKKLLAGKEKQDRIISSSPWDSLEERKQQLRDQLQEYLNH